MAEPTELRAALLVAVTGDGEERVLGRVGARGADLALVDALLRLELVLRRRGSRVCLRDAPADLAGLVGLIGVADVLAVEPGRQAELGEHLGVEEVPEPRDPPL